MKRWGIHPLRGYPAFVPIAALALLAPTAARAAEPIPASAYKSTVPVCAKDAYAGFRSFQVGGLNNKGQFTFNMVGDGERIYAWDGAKVVTISDGSKKLPDGTTYSTANVYSPHGINDAGKVVWIADADTGDHVLMLFDLATGTYTLLAKPGQPAPGGGEFLNADAVYGPSHRQQADINNKDQVVWNQPVAGVDGAPHNSIFRYDLATQQSTAIMRSGTPAPGGKVFDHAWSPYINDQGQIIFIASVDGSDQYGVYLWEAGNITAIAEPGMKIGDLTIDQTGYARIAENGDIAFVAQFGEGHPVLSEGTTADTAVVLYTAADKRLQTILKPGDPLPGGLTFKGIEADRSPVGVNSRGQVVMTAVAEDDHGGIYLWQGGKLEALARFGETIPGVGQVTGLSRRTADAAGATWSGRHTTINENGDVVFTAQIDGISCFVMATAPKPATAPSAGN